MPPAASASGPGSPLPHPHWDKVPHPHRNWAHPCHIRTGTGPTPATSAPGLGSPLTSAPGLGPYPRPHLHRDSHHAMPPIRYVAIYVGSAATSDNNPPAAALNKFATILPYRCVTPPARRRAAPLVVYRSFGVACRVSCVVCLVCCCSVHRTLHFGAGRLVASRVLHFAMLRDAFCRL